MSNRILISGWYGSGNIGDEAILQALIDDFREKYPGCLISVLSTNPVYTKKTQGVNAYYQIPFGILSWAKNIFYFRWINSLIALATCDLFVMGGGGFLSDWQPKVPGGWLKQHRIAKFFKKETWLYGIGAGPFDTQKGKEAVKFYLDNYVDKIVVRDRQSYEQILSCGVKKRPISIQLDPVAKMDVSKYLKIENETPYDFGVIYTEFFDRKLFGEQQNRRKALLECYHAQLQHLTSTGNKVKLIFFQSSIEKNLAQELINRNPLISIGEPASYQEAIPMMAQCKAIISFRLHGNILAYSLKKPFLPIVYHHKAMGFLELIDYEPKDCVIEVGDGVNWPHSELSPDTWIAKTETFKAYISNKNEKNCIHN